MHVCVHRLIATTLTTRTRRSSARPDGRQLTAHTASTSTSTSASRDTNHATYASSRTAILRPDDPHVRNDIIRMIDQWLADEGFGATRQLLMEEAGIKRREREEAGLDARKLRGHILEGDWPEVDKLLQKPLVKNHKAFLYAVYKQQFLEHIEHREFQKGFTFLNKRLKPLEHYQPHPSEFRDLCYLLSAKAVTDAPSFAAWEGIQPARRSSSWSSQPCSSRTGSRRRPGFPARAPRVAASRLLTPSVPAARHPTCSTMPCLPTEVPPPVGPRPH